MKRFFGALLITLVLAGCGEPKIDASTADKMKSSIAKVRDALPEDKRAQFDDALKVAAFSQLSMKELMPAGDSDDPSVLQHKIGDALEGKTGEQVIAYAKTVKEEKAKKERDQGLQEIKLLEARKVAFNDKAEKIIAFVATGNYHLEISKNKPAEPVITMNVENGTPHVVSFAGFIATIRSPGREVPWFSELFSYEIPGGIEPGEKAQWILRPGANSKWAKIRFPKDAYLQFVPVELRDENSKSIFSNVVFFQKDSDRLAKLKAKYQSEEK